MTGQQLKNSILQMAVQGKLVPQNPDDEPASVLLDRIRKEKEQLIKEKKIKKEKNPSYIFRGADNLPYEKVGNGEPVCIADEVPFEIPENWEWVRLFSLGEIVSGGTPKTSDNENWENATIPWLTPADMKYVTGKYVGHGKRFISEYGLAHSSAQLMPAGSILYSSRAPIGYIAISENSICTNQGFKSLVPVIPDLNDYLYYCLIALTPSIQARASGTTFKEISGTEFGKTLIPVPPLIEQKRIVTKIEEAMPGVEQYSKLANTLTKLDHDFPDSLKKSILQWAVQGKLVPQDPNDEPASILLERIRAEKEQLVREGKIKRDKHESVIFRRDNSYYEKCGNEEICLDDEIPFEIPPNWSWTRAFSLGTMIRGKGIKRTETVASGAPCIRYGEIYTSYNVSFTKAISYIPSTLDEICPHLSSGDVVFTLTGENKVDIAKAVAFMGENQIAAGGDLAFWTAHGMNPLYLVYYMSSPYCIEQKRRTATGDIIVHISTAKVGNFLVPVPPLNEQKRIVSAIESFFAIIATL